MAGIGHNRPPADLSWAAHCWRKAHAAAWKTPPREVALRRMALARDLGLTYRELTAILLDRGTYPRAVVVAPVSAGRAAAVDAKLNGLRCRRILLPAQGADLAATLAGLRLPPDAAILVGWTQADRRAAERAGLAGFFWGDGYFGDAPPS